MADRYSAPTDAVRLPSYASLISGASVVDSAGLTHSQPRSRHASDYLEATSPTSQRRPSFLASHSSPYQSSHCNPRLPLPPPPPPLSSQPPLPPPPLPTHGLLGSPIPSSAASGPSAGEYVVAAEQIHVHAQPSRRLGPPLATRDVGHPTHVSTALPSPPWKASSSGQRIPVRDLHDRQAPSFTTSQRTEGGVRIKDLLTNGAEVQPSPAPPSKDQDEDEYRIYVRQQPKAARSCGFGERDRRAIDPPPIVQLTITNPRLSKEEISQRLRNQFFVVHCTIWSKEGKEDCSIMPEDYRQQRRLMGSLAASAFVGEDENGEEGCFFCFSDLSCRTSGEYRLRFSVVVLDPLRGEVGKNSAIRASVMSDVFTVYSAKDFPGMLASTPLTRRLRDQGCLISIKKGKDRGGSRGRDGDYSSGEDEEGASSGTRKRPKKQ